MSEEIKPTEEDTLFIRERSIAGQFYWQRLTDEDRAILNKYEPFEAWIIGFIQGRTARESRATASEGIWKVKAVIPTKEDPFNTFECKAIDIGYSDKILVVELPDLTPVTRAEDELKGGRV